MNPLIIKTKRIIISICYNNKLIKISKFLFFYFPLIEERVRVLAYILKKSKHTIVKPLRNGHSLMLDPQKPNDRNINQLLFDVSELKLRDVHTGIQRVLHALSTELAKYNNNKYIFRLVYSDPDGKIRYLKDPTCATVRASLQSQNIDSCVVEVKPGDLFFSADLYMHFPFSALQSLRQKGLRVIWTVHDLFGLTIPEMLPRSYSLAFSDWYKGVINTADGIVCVSRTIADELVLDLKEKKPSLHNDIYIGYFYHGANINSVSHYTIKSNEANNINFKEYPIFLMVGTLEPRKGHIPALGAFDILWKQGVNINLVIVGKEGWRSHELVRKLRRHPERNKRLFWLENASDALLITLYQQSSALLAASFAEGFGLPLIEAAYYGLPIIARDIPVFREVAGEFAYYFPNTGSADLASSIRQWLALNAEGKAPPSKGMPYLTWEQSTQQLLSVILENNWYTVYHPTDTSPTHG